MNYRRNEVPADLQRYFVRSEIGLESTPDAYVAELVAVFREVRRVLRDDGTLWLNLGDSYAAQRGGTTPPAETLAGGIGGHGEGDAKRGRPGGFSTTRHASGIGLKHKDLIGIPWMVAFALRADGWWLRQDIIWSKPNPMPESVTDRCTKAHEYLFLLSKSATYHCNMQAIAEPAIAAGEVRGGNRNIDPSRRDAARDTSIPVADTRNKRSVWTVATQPFSAGGLVGGTTYTVSSDCPAHGLHADPDRWQRAARDEPQDHLRYRIDGNDARHALERLAEFEASSCRTPTSLASVHGRKIENTAESKRPDPLLDAGSPAAALSSRCRTTRTESSHAPLVGSSGLLPQRISEPATPSNTQSRKTALAPGTSQPCTAFDQKSQSTADKSELLDCSDSVARTRVNSTAEDSAAGAKRLNPLAEKASRTASRCTCVEHTTDHFATFPPALIEPCILAGCPVGGTVLDPFGGAGTTGLVADRLQRNAVLIELNPTYAHLARHRVTDDAPLFAEVAA